MMTVSPSRHYSGHCKAVEKEDDPGTVGKGIWKNKRGRRLQKKMKAAAQESSGPWLMLHYE